MSRRDDEAPPLPAAPLPQLLEVELPRVQTQVYRFPPAHSFPPARDCDRDTLIAIAARTAMGAGHELLAAPEHCRAICALLAHELAPEAAAADLTIAALRADAAATKIRLSTHEEALRRERRTTLQEIQRAVAALERASELHLALEERSRECATLHAENLELRRLVLMYGPDKLMAPAGDDEFDFGGNTNG